MFVRLSAHPDVAAVDRALIDEVLDVYVDWREGCVAVQAAYEKWSATNENRRLAFAAYAAALDREDRASRRYADLIVRVGRIIGARDPRDRLAVGAP